MRRGRHPVRPIYMLSFESSNPPTDTRPKSNRNLLRPLFRPQPAHPRRDDRPPNRLDPTHRDRLGARLDGRERSPRPVCGADDHSDFYIPRPERLPCLYAVHDERAGGVRSGHVPFRGRGVRGAVVYLVREQPWTDQSEHGGG